MDQDLQQKLNRLEELIIQERDYARTLKVVQIKELQQEKGDLIKELQSENVTYSAEIKILIKKIQRENIRNAKLLHTCLGNLRQMMSHCAQQLTPVSYGKHGACVQNSPSGLLLNGRI